jgi:hypothetical protein
MQCAWPEVLKAGAAGRGAMWQRACRECCAQDRAQAVHAVFLLQDP